MSVSCSKLVASVVAAMWCVVALAQGSTPAYPVRPIRVVVPFPPGAGADIVTRIVVPRVGESLGQSFVVDNRGGAGGIVGTEIASRAPADGYNLYTGGTALIVTPLLGKVPYSARDFAPIARMASVPFILVVHPSMPVKSLSDLVQLARSKPGALNYASTGEGTTPHLTTALFRYEAKIDLTHVPYKGSAPALTDLLGGHVDLFFCNMLSATALVANGRLRALAVTSLRRSPVAPQVPTVAESGYPNFETVTWFGLMGPNGVPGHIVTRLSAEVARALRRNDVQAELAAQGATPMIDTGPNDMAAYINSETQKWSRVIKAIGLKAH